MNKVFDYLAKGFSPKKIIIYGMPDPDDLVPLKGVDLILLNEDTGYLLKMREIYPEFNYESSLYFLKDKCDLLINLTTLPLHPEVHLTESGVYITINIVLSDFDYHAKTVNKVESIMKYHQQIKLHFAPGIVALAGDEAIWFDPRELCKKVPEYIVECHSNRVIPQGNGIFF